MLQLDVCEGKEAESRKKWSHLPSGTAQTLRLTEHWHDSERLVIGDSAFSSVTTAIECYKCGLFYTGVLKTTSREYPRDYLNDTSKYTSRGDHICLTSTTDGCSLIALGWKDKTVKTFVSTCGTTLPGKPHQKHRYSHSGAIITTEVQRPQVPRSISVQQAKLTHIITFDTDCLVLKRHGVLKHGGNNVWSDCC